MVRQRLLQSVAGQPQQADRHGDAVRGLGQQLHLVRLGL
jgi:hypothetical protein